jgi:hypothetical protein
MEESRYQPGWRRLHVLRRLALARARSGTRYSRVSWSAASGSVAADGYPRPGPGNTSPRAAQPLAAMS